jgi:YHS domain-containing protein
MIRNLIIALSLLGLASCHSHQPAEQAAGKTDTAMAASSAAAPKPDLKSLHFDYAKDPACGMPLRAGLEDTTHYKGKLYGFCSKECKSAFLKDPASYIAQAK